MCIIFFKCIVIDVSTYLQMQHANVSFNSKPSTKQIFECIQPSSNNTTKTPCEPFSHNSNQTDLVSSLLGAQPEVGDVDRLGKTSLGRGIKHLVERDVLEHLVHSQLVWVDHHLDTVSYGLEQSERTNIWLLQAKCKRSNGWRMGKRNQKPTRRSSKVSMVKLS